MAQTCFNKNGTSYVIPVTVLDAPISSWQKISASVERISVSEPAQRERGKKNWVLFKYFDIKSDDIRKNHCLLFIAFYWISNKSRQHNLFVLYFGLEGIISSSGCTEMSSLSSGWNQLTFSMMKVVISIQMYQIFLSTVIISLPFTKQRTNKWICFGNVVFLLVPCTWRKRIPSPEMKRYYALKNHIFFEIGRDLWRLTCLTLFPKQSHLQQIAQYCPVGFWISEGWRLHYVIRLHVEQRRHSFVLTNRVETRDRENSDKVLSLYWGLWLREDSPVVGDQILLLPRQARLWTSGPTLNQQYQQYDTSRIRQSHVS